MGKGSGIAVSCGIVRRCSLDPESLWLWCRPATKAPIRPLSWDLHMPHTRPLKNNFFFFYFLKKKKNYTKATKRGLTQSTESTAAAQAHRSFTSCSGDREALKHSSDCSQLITRLMGLGQILYEFPLKGDNHAWRPATSMI